MTKYKICFVTIIISAAILVNGYYTHRMYKFDKQVEKWSKFKDLQINCLEALDDERNQQITDLSNHRLKPIHVLWVYNHNLPECDKLAKERCWIFDWKDPINMEHCKDRLDPEEYNYWKKTGKNPWSRNTK